MSSACRGPLPLTAPTRDNIGPQQHVCLKQYEQQASTTTYRGLAVLLCAVLDDFVQWHSLLFNGRGDNKF